VFTSPLRKSNSFRLRRIIIGAALLLQLSLCQTLCGDAEGDGDSDYNQAIDIFLLSGEVALEKMHIANIFHGIIAEGGSSVFAGPIASGEAKSYEKFCPIDLRTRINGCRFGFSKTFTTIEQRGGQISIYGGIVHGNGSVFAEDNNLFFKFSRNDFAIASSARFFRRKSSGLSCSTNVAISFGSGSIKCTDGKLYIDDGGDYCRKFHDSDLQVSVFESRGLFRRGEVEISCIAGLRMDLIAQNNFMERDGMGDESEDIGKLRHRMLTTELAAKIEDAQPNAMHLFGKIGWQCAVLRKYSGGPDANDVKTMPQRITYGNRHSATISVGISHRLAKDFICSLTMEDHFGSKRASNTATITIYRTF
jgi:hypothetical protein